MTEVINVVIADDSSFVCSLLSSYLQSCGDFRVVGVASNGKEALQLISKNRPDVVLLDLNMPVMSGIDALERIMADDPIPVVMISGTSTNAAELSLKALQLGAVDFIFKFSPGEAVDADAMRNDIVARVRAAAKSTRHNVENQAQAAVQAVSGEPLSVDLAAEAQELPQACGKQIPARDVIVVGASTGGPIAIRDLLSNIPPEFPGALLIVQHLPAGFSDVMAAQLDKQFPFKFKVAEHGDRLIAGQALIAPGDYHILIGSDERIELNQSPELEGHRPSVTLTLNSAAKVFGERCHAILLSGMGTDGSEGLQAVHYRGGRTYVQSPESCVVSSMPQKAIETGAVNYIAPPETLARFLLAECLNPGMEIVH